MKWIIRFEDVYLSGYDRFLRPCWGPRNEAIHYVARDRAKGSLVRCRSFYAPDADLAVVRLVPKTEEDTSTCSDCNATMNRSDACRHDCSPKRSVGT